MAARRFKKRRRFRRSKHKSRRNRFSRSFRKTSRRNKPTRWKVGHFYKDAAFGKFRFNYSFQMAIPATTSNSLGVQIEGNCLAPNITAFQGTTLTPAVPAIPTPVGYKTMATLYDYYKVFGTKVKIMMINAGPAGAAASGQAMWGTLIPVSSGQLASNLEAPDILANLPMSQRKLIINSINQTTKPYVWKQYISTRKIEGITKSEFEGPDYNSLTGASPTKIWNWYLIFNSMLGNDLVAQNATFHVEMTFFAKFYRKNISPTEQ